MSVTKDEVFDLINANNDQLIAFRIQTAWADVSEDVKRIYSAQRRARAILSSRKMKSSAMAATKRSSDSPLRGQFCVQVPNCKVSPCSQPLLIRASCLVVLTLAHASLVQKLGISVLLRCPAMKKQSDSPTSKWQEGLTQDLPGVVLSCFDRNDFILRILWPALLLAMFFR